MMKADSSIILACYEGRLRMKIYSKKAHTLLFIVVLLVFYGCTPAAVETSAEDSAQPNDQTSADDSGSSSQGDDNESSATAEDPAEPVDVSDPTNTSDPPDEVVPEPVPEPEPEPEPTPIDDCVAETEICDGVDNDCDGEIDEGVLNMYYHDADSDGYGDSTDSILSCTSPASYVSNSSDCNDASANVRPGATEICDGVDNDCDGSVDENLWPSDVGFNTIFASVGTDIGDGLASGYEPSGVVWHSGLDQLFVVSDGGIVTRMNSDGSGVVDKIIGGDFEGITMADPSTDFVYIGVEHPDSILEYNIEIQTVTRTFSLVAYMTGADNAGLEALTFVPNSSSDEGGYFYAGLQETGEVFIFELPIVSSSLSTTVHFVDSFSTPYSDISGMYYDENNDVLYAVYDGANKLVAMETDGTFIAEWSLPSATQDQEGFTIGDSCHVFLAEDTRTVWRY